MSISGNLNTLLDSKVTGLLVFGITGAAKVASDYKNAPENKKDFVVLRDSIILGGTALGVGAYSLAHGKVVKNQSVKNSMQKLKNNLISPIKNSAIYKKISPVITTPLEKVCKNTLKVLGDCTDNTLMLGAGILGAIGADYGIRLSHLDKRKKMRKLAQISDDKMGSLYKYESRIINDLKNSKINKDLETTLGSEVKSNVYSRITDLPAMRMFSRTMVGVQGFEVIEEQTFKKRMKHATSCLISNSIVPLFFLSTATRLTKGMNTMLRAPVIFASLVGGTMYTNKAIKHFEHKAETPKTNISAETNNETNQTVCNTQNLIQLPDF